MGSKTLTKAFIACTACSPALYKKPHMRVDAACGSSWALSPTLKDAMQDPGKTKGGPSIMFAAAAALLQLRLLEAYLALPDASAFTMEHAAVSKLCARALRSAPGQAGSGEQALISLSSVSEDDS